MPAWRPLAGLVKSLSALLGRGPRHSCAARGFHPRPTLEFVPQPRLRGGLDACRSGGLCRRCRPAPRQCALGIVHVLGGAIVFEATIAASSQGYAGALRLVDAHAPGLRAFAVEGSGSFGAGLTRLLTGRGERVLEVSRLRRERRTGSEPMRSMRSSPAPLRSRPHLVRPSATGSTEAAIAN